MPGFNMDDYVSVAQRIDAFHAKYPDGSLQSEIVEMTPDRVTVKAYAYRWVDDARPGIGHSTLQIPGSTSFTKGSELENAETSAWGRAIAALGFEVKRGLASAEEVRNKQPQGGERAPERGGARSKPATTRPAASPVKRSAEEQELLDQLLATHVSISQLELMAKDIGVKSGEHANADQLREMLRRMTQPSSGVPTAPAEGEAGGSVPASPTTPPSEGSPDSSGSDAATGPAGAASPPVQPDPAPTLDDILEATGGELLPPKPGTDEYKALRAPERAAARAYWQSEGIAP